MATIKQLSTWGLLCRHHPTPWVLDQCNKSGVLIKDGKGDTVFYEDLSAIPDEMTSTQADDIRIGAVALANWLIAYANNE